MKSRFTIFSSFILLSTAAVSSGCAYGPVDDDESTVEYGYAVASSNRLSMNRLSMNRLSMNGLSSGSLSPDGLNLASTDLLLDDSGRELLHYLVRCALPEGSTLTGTVSDVTYVFNGLIGLAPEWLTRPLSQRGQRWMSACLLAHVNGYGIEVPISLRGDNAALASDESERSAFTKQEVSFFGNVFVPNPKMDELGDAGLRMYSCGGSTLQLECGGSAATFSPMRSCAGSASCELEFTGPCVDLSKLGNDTCKGATKDGFTKCHTTVRDVETGEWPESVAYTEVITVYLRQADWSYLYPGCAPLSLSEESAAQPD